MVSDSRAQQAREHHRDAQQSNAEAERHRQQRDRLVHELRRTDPKRWTYAALASAVGCSPELIAVILRAPDDPPAEAEEPAP